MRTTVKTCYQGVDRSVLLDMKKVFEELKKKMLESPLGEIELNAYTKLNDLFTKFINRPFFQGDDEYTVENEIVKDFFIETINAVRKYIKLNISITDVERHNLDFRLSMIYSGNRTNIMSYQENEFANGAPVDIRNMPIDEYKRAAQEFAEGSKALEDFLQYTYANKMYTKACCKGHERPNSGLSGTYIAFDLGEDDEKKEYLMSQAFENDMEVVFIKFNTGLGFDLSINPYEIEEKVAFLQKCLDNYKGDEPINPIISKIKAYAQSVAPMISNKAFAIRCGRTKDGRIIIEENEGNNVLRGVFSQDEVIERYGKMTYLEPLSIEVLEPPKVESREVARSVLNLTKSFPGKFAESMKNVLGMVKQFIGRDKDEDRESK